MCCIKIGQKGLMAPLAGVLILLRNCESKRASTTWVCFSPYLAMVQFNDSSAVGETDSVLSTGVGLGKVVKGAKTS